MTTTFEGIEQVNTGILTSLQTDLNALVADNELEQIYFQNYSDLSEGIANVPLIQVYWQGHTTPDSIDRHTFRGGIKQIDATFHIDLYLDNRSNIDQIFPQMFPLLNAIDKTLQSQDTKPYFGVSKDVLKAFSIVSAERATFQYETSSDTSRSYPGVRFVISTRLF